MLMANSRGLVNRSAGEGEGHADGAATAGLGVDFEAAAEVFEAFADGEESEASAAGFADEGLGGETLVEAAAVVGDDEGEVLTGVGRSRRRLRGRGRVWRR